MTPRERLTNSLSLMGTNVTVYTFEAVKTTFLELFCTATSSIENPSLRVGGHVSSMNRTFTVEDCAEDDLGQWAKGEVTGEQGYVDDVRSCFWTWDDTECVWQPRPFKGRQLKRGKGKGKGMHKSLSKRSGRAFLGEEQAQYSEMWSEEDFAWWTKRRKSKKGLSKGHDGFQKGGFRPNQPDRGANKDYIDNKSTGKYRKRKSKEEAHPQSGLSASEAPELEGFCHAWESDAWSSCQWPDDSWTSAAGWCSTKAHTAWMAVPSWNLAYHPTHVVLDLGCRRSIGSRSAIV